MRFANLLLALANDDRPRWKLARLLGCSERRLSSCLSGRQQFRPEERAGLAKILGYSQAWLFEVTEPPKRAEVVQQFAPAAL